jgi:hypothetical protein
MSRGMNGEMAALITQMDVGDFGKNSADCLERVEGLH